MWGDKRYYSFDYFVKETFGHKLYKLALPGGVTCPNRDGTVGTRGCIFCSEGGSGDFCPPAGLTLDAQIDEAITRVSAKLPRGGSEAQPRYIAYFQSYTATYLPPEDLRNKLEAAVSHPETAAVSVGARPDCLGDGQLAALDSANRVKPVFVELGLQTIHDSTAEFIRRGYPFRVFEEAVRKLKSLGLYIVVHVIIGLPGETEDMLMQTIDCLSRMDIHGVKLQLLHILKGTDLYLMYKNDDAFARANPPLSMELYIDLLIKCLERLPPQTVIHRLTGDGPKSLLFAPIWSCGKKTVLNAINAGLRQRNTWQGRLYIP